LEKAISSQNHIYEEVFEEIKFRECLLLISSEGFVFPSPV